MTVAQDLIRDSLKSLSLWFDHYDSIMEALPEDEAAEPDKMVTESWQVVQAQVRRVSCLVSKRHKTVCKPQDTCMCWYFARLVSRPTLDCCDLGCFGPGTPATRPAQHVQEHLVAVHVGLSPEQKNLHHLRKEERTSSSSNAECSAWGCLIQSRWAFNASGP